MITPLTILEMNMNREDEIFLRSETYRDYLKMIREGDEILVAHWGRLTLERVTEVECGEIYIGEDRGISQWYGSSCTNRVIMPPAWNYPIPNELTPGIYWEDMLAFKRAYCVVVRIDGREVHIHYMLDDRLPLFARVGVCYPRSGEVYIEVRKKLEYYFSRQYRHTLDLFNGWTK